MDSSEIIRLGELVLEGYIISEQEAISLTDACEDDIPLLGAYANKIRAKFAGKKVDMCGVINARSGLCTEDCKFCSQSVYHQTNAQPFPLISKQEALDSITNFSKAGAERASIVTSGKGMENDPDFERIVTLIKHVTTESEINICANLGTISYSQAAFLVQSGIKRYAHNLETSQNFYPQICTTHPYQERLNTLLAAKKAGLELCSGGIIGLGESWNDRISLALTLRSLDIDSIPINILNPIQGTLLEKQTPLSPLEILKTFAIFRFILPNKVIRPAGGREINLRDMQGAVMLAGANGLIVGNYLTFGGRDIANDFIMVNDAGLVPILNN
ncbi:Biotin synthase [Sporomusa silvacetica DSM 10669]|uniref:Biotin synthase n=1 Tax=Sporomusa silvacetica DSM 10669 TaxID=1123289 RepID=A0ABZ3IJ13_9FIRM|nr:biotin synthase BioB [Sporomusa silvacetica]OZC18914.1 biotin synthase [Sporomusa silvacetica DSM 10669]